MNRVRKYEMPRQAATAHRLEQLLKTGSRYLWSVRACFDLDERPACTPWAFSLVPAQKDACESTVVAPENYYLNSAIQQFRLAKKEGKG